MCLLYVYAKEPTEDSGIGYKIFLLLNNKFNFMHRELNGVILVPTNKWIKAESSILRAENGAYQSGFHIYKEKPSSAHPHIKIVEVQYRGVICSGYETYGPAIIVAREMFVHDGVNLCV